MSLDNKTNLGWHFNQNYFVNDNGSLMNLSADELKRDSTEELFKKKNKEITQTPYDISYFNGSQSSFDLYTTYPGLLLGTGYGHEVSAKGEFKLGFFFDYTTGLPIIPGSSIKGILRSVFPDIKDDKLKNEIDRIRVAWLMSLLGNIKDDDFLEKYYEPASPVTDEEIKKWISITLEIFEGVKDNSKTKPQDRFYTIYERDIFHDAVLKSAGKDKLVVGEDALAPHVKDNMTYEQSMLHNPVPIPFMKVLPQVGFSFRFDVKDSHIESQLTVQNKIKLFQKILLALGVGAKTNVGYGQFTIEKPDLIDTNIELRNAEGVTPAQVPRETGDLFTNIQMKSRKAIIDKKVFEGVCIKENDSNFQFKFMVNNLPNYVVKKKKKCPSNLKINDEIEIEFNSVSNNMDFDNPPFIVKLKS